MYIVFELWKIEGQKKKEEFFLDTLLQRVVQLSKKKKKKKKKKKNIYIYIYIYIFFLILCVNLIIF